MPGYEEIAVLEDPDGCSARITKRTGEQGKSQYSFQFFRSYYKDGELCETVWFSRRHLQALGRLAIKIDDHLEAEYKESP